MRKQIKTSVLVLIISFIVGISNIKALTSINVSSVQELYDTFTNINSSSNLEYKVSLSNDIEIDNNTITANGLILNNNNKVTLIGNNHKIKFITGDMHKIIINNGTLVLGKSDNSDSLSIEGAGVGSPSGQPLIVLRTGQLDMYSGVSLSNNWSNSAMLVGCGVRMGSNTTFNMYGGSIHDNTSTSYGIGGAVFLEEDNATFNMTGGEITNNTVSDWGGAVYIGSNSTVNISNANISGNKAGYGGAIASTNGTTTISNSILENNTGSYGGAIIAYDSGNNILENNIIRNNSASFGGGIYTSTTITSTNDVITQNTASKGGGVEVAAGSFKALTTKVYNNKATVTANDYYISNSAELEIIDSTDINEYVNYDDRKTNIKGWYNDAEDNRYSMATPTNIVNYSTIIAGGTYYLTAAGNEVYTVKFESDESSEIAEQIVELDEKVTEPTAPSKTGYQFLYWEDESQNEYDFNNNVNSNMTLKAKYKTIVYNIKYNLNGGKLEQSNLTNYTIETDTFTLNNPVKEGYNFLGWKLTGSDEILSTVTISKGSINDLVFEAIFEKIEDTEEEIEDTEEEIDYNIDNPITGNDDVKNPETLDNILIYPYLLLISIIGLLIVGKKIKNIG